MQKTNTHTRTQTHSQFTIRQECAILFAFDLFCFCAHFFFFHISFDLNMWFMCWCVGVRSHSLPEGHWPCGEGLRFYFTHMWLSWAPSSEDKRAPRYIFTVRCSHIHTYTCTHCAYIKRSKLDINQTNCKWLHAHTECSECFSQCNCCPCSNVSVCHGFSIIEFHYAEYEAAALLLCTKHTTNAVAAISI